MKKKLIVTVLLLPAIIIAVYFLFFSNHYRPPEDRIAPLSAEVLYDESHGNVWGIHDTGFYGYSGFAKLLIEHGLPVSRITGSLENALKKNPGAFTTRVLVLNVAKFASYTLGEQAAVESFVRAGGALLCIGEHENMYGSSDFQNGILHHFGMEFVDDYVGDIIPEEKLAGADVAILNQKAVSYAFGLDAICHLLSAPVVKIKGSSGFTELLQGYRNGKTVTIGAGTLHGLGRVAAIGDSELFWNGDGRIGIDAGDNRLLLVRLFQWLLKGELVPVQENIPCLFTNEPAESGKRIFIDTSSHGSGINKSAGGLKALADFLREKGHAVAAGDTCSDYDIRLVANPLTTVECGFQKKERLIIVGGSYQNITYDNWGKMLFSLKVHNQPSVYDAIDKRYAIKVQPCFLTDGGINKDFFTISFSFKGIPTLMHRAGSVDIKGSSLRKWLAPASAVWGETVHPGVENRNRGIPMYDGADIQDPVIAAGSEDFLIILCGDSFTNAASDHASFLPLCAAVEAWIMTGAIR